MTDVILDKQIDDMIGDMLTAPKDEPTSELEPKPDTEPAPKPGDEPKPPSGDDPKPPVKDDEPAPGTEPKPKPDLKLVPDEVTPEPPIVDQSAEELKEQNSLLLQRIEELTSQLTGVPTPLPVIEPKKDEPKPSDIPPTPKSADVPSSVQMPEVGKPIDFIGNLNIDDVIDDKNKFNDLLNKVFITGVMANQEIMKGNIIPEIPRLISKHVEDKAAVDDFLNKFYSANEELKNVKMTVSHVVKQVHAEKPDLKPAEVFNEAAERTRKMLGIRKVTKKADGDFNDPAFVHKKGGSKVPAKGADGLQSQIDELITH